MPNYRALLRFLILLRCPVALNQKLAVYAYISKGVCWAYLIEYAIKTIIAHVPVLQNPDLLKKLSGLDRIRTGDLLRVRETSYR